MSSTGDRISEKEIRELYNQLSKEELINIAVVKTREIWGLHEKLEAVQGEYNRLVHK